MKQLSLDLCQNYIADECRRGGSNERRLNEVKVALRRVIAEQLTDRQREVAVLYFYKKLNIPQIAELLRVNKSTVSRTLARALKHINDHMKYYSLR